MKNKVHLQLDWSPAVGEIVEIRLKGRIVRVGRVDGVTPDDQILWIAADGAEPRAMFERSDGYSVWIEYRWETASTRPVRAVAMEAESEGSKPQSRTTYKEFHGPPPLG